MGISDLKGESERDRQAKEQEGGNDCRIRKLCACVEFSYRGVVSDFFRYGDAEKGNVQFMALDSSDDIRFISHLKRCLLARYFMCSPSMIFSVQYVVNNSNYDIADLLPFIRGMGIA